MDEVDVYEVSLSVYERSQGSARQLPSSFSGEDIETIWQTGIILYGKEYYFDEEGLHHFAAGTTPYGTPVKVVDLGITYLPEILFDIVLLKFGPRYTAETYSLTSNNSINFSNEVALFLMDKGIPDNILQIINGPIDSLKKHMLQNLESTSKAGDVPHAPQSSRTSAGNPSNTTPGPLTSESEEKPSSSGIPDPHGDARTKVKEEITGEFNAIMETGTKSANEAAVLAVKKVMRKYGK